MDPSLRAQSDVDQQLERLSRQLLACRSELYSQLALYLQVLRKALLASVQQGCFTLVTRHADVPYAALPSEQRQELHRRTSNLVQRCSSLLTVEQLAVLGGQLERQQRRAQQRQQQQLLAALEGVQERREPPEPVAVPSVGGSGEALPPGSVRLDLAPPLLADLFSHGLPPLAAMGTGLAAPAVAPPETWSEPLSEPLSEPVELQALMALALEAGGPEPGAELPPTSGLLPDDPVALLAWWERFEQALQRRLRNLSHAINVELLRIGLIRSLLPVHLLDAVLAGQIDPLQAPANLLRLQLPMHQVEKGPPLEINGLLLRCSDLEYEQPRLRTCRQRLREQHQSLRRMAQQYRHWQRRAQVLEAEQLWLQDSGAKGSQPPAD